MKEQKIRTKIGLLKINVEPKQAIKIEIDKKNSISDCNKTNIIYEIEQTNKNRKIFFQNVNFHSSESTFFSDINDSLKYSKNYQTKKILIFDAVELKGVKRWILFSFNDCRALINSNFFESNAGIKTIINKLISDGEEKILFKTIDQTETSSGDRKKYQAVKSTENIKQLEYNEYLWDINTISIECKLGGFKQTISTGKFIICSWKTRNIFEDILNIFSSNYGTKLYKENHPYIDNWNEAVEDICIINELDNILLKNIREDRISKINFTWPDWEDENFKNFIIKHKKHEIFKMTEIFTIDNFLFSKIIGKLKIKYESFHKNFKSIIREVKIYSINQNNVAIESFNIWECIIFEINFKNDTYILKTGEWQKISSKVVNELNTFTKIVEQNKYKGNFKFINWNKDNNENKYSKKLVKLNNATLIDRKLVLFGKYMKLEIGDILCKKENEIFAIKHLRSSQSISHLIFQVINARDAILNDYGKINKQLNYDFQNINKIVLAIGTERSNRPDNIQFFAKRSLLYLLKRENNIPKILFQIIFFPYVSK